MPTYPPPEPAPTRAVHACGYSHPGRKREHNEDAFGVFLDDRLFVVADGMGGRAGGEVAARIAVDEVEIFFRTYRAQPRQPWPYPLDKAVSLGENLLRVGLKVANQKIRKSAETDPGLRRMGATFAALAVGETRVVAAHVGDVRIYCMRDGTLSRLTRDHSVLEELLAAKPEMAPEDVAAIAPRSVVTRALGSKEDVEPTVSAHDLAPGDVYLICCDGLWDPVPAEQIETTLAAHQDIEQACQALIDAANTAGGPDNITAVVVRV